MKRIWTGLFLMVQVIACQASLERTVAGGRAASLGGSAVACPGIWSVSANQAGLAWQEGWQAGLFAGNRFFVKELSMESLSLTWAGKPGAFGLSISHYGFRSYHEFSAGLSYALKFGKRFSMGVKLGYLQLSIAEGYGSKGALTSAIGWMYRPDDAWTLGMQVCNPVPVRLTSYPEERLPTIFRLGVGYALSGKLLILLEGEKDLEHSLIIRTGAEMRMGKGFFTRIGLHSGPFTVTAGVGLVMGKLSADIAMEYHTVLGFSPGVSLEYQFTR